MWARDDLKNTTQHPTSPVGKWMISKNNSAPYLSGRQVDDLKKQLSTLPLL